jgi:pimeloyl-ACP methyl ester carboxylesterase
MKRALLLSLAVALASAGCLSHHAGPLPGAPKGATFEVVKGTRVHYTDEGEGPPVVLIHGFASSLGTWTAVRRELKKSHRVIALDLKGFGWTDRPEGDYSLEAQADLVLGLLGALGVEEPVALVAHSWGSSVALQIALRQPGRVTRIALYDAWVYEEQIPMTFLWSRAGGMGEFLIGAFYDERPDDKIAIAFHDPKYVTEELIETVEDQLARPGTKAAALAAIRGQRYEEVQKKYPTIDKPVLLLWGREDRVTPLDVGERLLKDLPNARLNVYPACGHFPMIEAHRPSTRDLATFLAETTPPSKAKPEPPPAKETEPAPPPVPTTPPPPAGDPGEEP